MSADLMKNVLWIGFSVAAIFILGAVAYQKFFALQTQPDVKQSETGGVIEQTDLQEYLQPHTNQNNYRDIDLKLPLPDELQNSLSEVNPEIHAATKAIHNASLRY